MVFVDVKSAFYFQSHVATPLHALQGVRHVALPGRGDEYQVGRLLRKHVQIVILVPVVALQVRELLFPDARVGERHYFERWQMLH